LERLQRLQEVNALTLVLLGDVLSIYDRVRETLPNLLG